jgi:formylmethanofuran dehydrogenase subunit E
VGVKKLHRGKEGSTIRKRKEEGMIDTGKIARKWQEESFELMSGMAEWRQQHPRATLREIETELDRRLERVRAKILEEAALMSEAREWEEKTGGPTCPDCGEILTGKVMGERKLQTQGGHEVVLERQYGVCPKCGQGFFPPG